MATGDSAPYPPATRLTQRITWKAYAPHVGGTAALDQSTDDSFDKVTSLQPHSGSWLESIQEQTMQLDCTCASSNSVLRGEQISESRWRTVNDKNALGLMTLVAGQGNKAHPWERVGGAEGSCGSRVLKSCQTSCFFCGWFYMYIIYML